MNKTIYLIVSVIGLTAIAFTVGATRGYDSGRETSNRFADASLEILSDSDVHENSSGEILEYDYSEAIDHIGEMAIIRGEVVKIFTSKTDTTFLDFCQDFRNCPFSAVIFASDKDKFGDLAEYQGKIRIKGIIKSYNGKAEIILSSPEQIL